MTEQQTPTANRPTDQELVEAGRTSLLEALDIFQWSYHGLHRDRVDWAFEEAVLDEADRIRTDRAMDR